MSMRPYLLAALLDADPDRPALVVAGDDRAARDLAAGLRQFLAPRPVRLYPARGVRYESHLAPPPHLVGLRIAALDELTEGGGPDGAAVVVAGAVALAEKIPDPELRPRSWSPAATSASSRSRSAGSLRCAATSSTSTRPPRSAPSAASCSTSRSSG